MARKLIPAEKKLASVLRVLQEGRPIADEARRLNIAVQTMARLVSRYVKQYPEADKRVKATASLPPPPEHTGCPCPAPHYGTCPVPAAGDAPAGAAPTSLVKPVESSAPASGGQSEKLIDAAAVKAAMEADGKLPSAPSSSTLPAPPAPGALSISSDKEDMEIVEGVSNQLMGWTCRVLVIWFEVRSGVQLPKAAMERIQELYVLTPTERAMLSPAKVHLARKIRELIGSSENVALTVGGSTVTGGLFDRYRIVAEAVAKEFEIQRPDLKAKAAQEAAEAAAKKGATA